MSDTRFTPGTPVIWTSQAGGYTKTKRGTVERFVPARSSITGAQLKRLQGQAWSTVDRYLVAVPRGGKSTLVDYYTPYASLVREDKP